MAENKWVAGVTRLSGVATLPIPGRGPLCTQSFPKETLQRYLEHAG